MSGPGPIKHEVIGPKWDWQYDAAVLLRSKEREPRDCIRFETCRSCGCELRFTVDAASRVGVFLSPEEARQTAACLTDWADWAEAHGDTECEKKSSPAPPRA